jgi:hypothetical protein
VRPISTKNQFAAGVWAKQFEEELHQKVMVEE